MHVQSQQKNFAKPLWGQRISRHLTWQMRGSVAVVTLMIWRAQSTSYLHSKRRVCHTGLCGGKSHAAPYVASLMCVMYQSHYYWHRSSPSASSSQSLGLPKTAALLAGRKIIRWESIIRCYCVFPRAISSGWTDVWFNYQAEGNNSAP